MDTRALVLAGLPCRLRCRRDPWFARVDLEPLPGWVHLSCAATRAAWGDWLQPQTHRGGERARDNTVGPSPTRRSRSPPGRSH